MAEFRVVLEGVKLGREHEEQIEAEIQSAVMRRLAAVDLGGDGLALGLPSLLGGGGTTKGLVAVVVDAETLGQLPNVRTAFDRLGPS